MFNGSLTPSTNKKQQQLTKRNKKQQIIKRTKTLNKFSKNAQKGKQRQSKMQKKQTEAKQCKQIQFKANKCNLEQQNAIYAKKQAKQRQSRFRQFSTFFDNFRKRCKTT